MKLLYQTHSPFARKTLVFAYETGLVDGLEVIHHETSPTLRNDEVFAANPLGKVPVLIIPDEDALFDSSVICAYLDQLHVGELLIPSDAKKRFKALRLEALADGLSEAGIMARWESVRRPEELRYRPLYDGMVDKISAGYDYAEKHVSPDDEITVGHIALATSLSWLEFRDMPTFRSNCPRLTEWYDSFAKRDSMLRTKLSGETHD